MIFTAEVSNLPANESFVYKLQSQSGVNGTSDLFGIDNCKSIMRQWEDTVGFLNVPRHAETCLRAYAGSECPDQLAPQRSLTWDFTVR